MQFMENVFYGLIGHTITCSRHLFLKVPSHFASVQYSLLVSEVFCFLYDQFWHLKTRLY